MALLSFVVSPRLNLVLMLLAIYNVDSSTAMDCSRGELVELKQEIKSLNMLKPLHYQLNITSSEQKNCTNLYFKTGLDQLAKFDSGALKTRFEFQDCLHDLSDVKDLKCKENPNSVHFMVLLDELWIRLNNLAQFKGRRRRRRRR